MSELLEKILDNRNMNEAYKKVCANKGAGGVDGMELNELYEYINKNWDSIKEQIGNREYKTQPVKRVEIPKPNGSKRKLGIPTVMDRVIQQGIVQIISPMCDSCCSFSASSSSVSVRMWMEFFSYSTMSGVPMVKPSCSSHCPSICIFGTVVLEFFE